MRPTSAKWCQLIIAFLTPKTNNMKRELISLFSGAGGLDWGFTELGFETVLAVDNCASAVNTFNFNAGRAVAVEMDLSKIKPDQLFDQIPRDAHPIGLIGGPPCQGFSQGNVFADINDLRNMLPYRYADLLKAANQKYQLHFFVFENVSGLAGPKHAKRLNRILKRLEGAGFTVSNSLVDASEFGVPQKRKRLFVVGINRELYPGVKFSFPKGTSRKRTVADAIKGLPKPEFFRRGLDQSEIPHHPNHWTMVPKSPKLKSGRSTGRSFRRLKWDEPSPTVAYGNREVHVHPDGGRRLSVFEAMLLQGFPKKYRLTGNLSSQITQVSNAVPPPVAKAIAKQIKLVMNPSGTV